MKTVSKAEGIYTSFGNPISEIDTNRFSKLQEKRSISSNLEPDEVKFLKNYEDRWQKANDNFAKNTQAAHTYYGSLADSIANIAPQIDEMADVIQTIKASLNGMNTKDLEMLQNSKTLKNFSQRINNYHTTFKNVQSELRNKHKINKIHRATPNYYSPEERDYDDLVAKVDSIHGLDKKIVEVKSKLDSLHKAIKSTMASKKRAENKQAAK
jgi:Mg2+ and Co2+ transporter CorA